MAKAHQHNLFPEFLLLPSQCFIQDKSRSFLFALALNKFVQNKFVHVHAIGWLALSILHTLTVHGYWCIATVNCFLVNYLCKQNPLVKSGSLKKFKQRGKNPYLLMLLCRCFASYHPIQLLFFLCASRSGLDNPSLFDAAICIADRTRSVPAATTNPAFVWPPWDT